MIEKRTATPEGLYVLFGDRDVGAVQLLRDAGPAGPLPPGQERRPQLGAKPTRSTWLYATYTSLVYLTPLLGGYLADKLLGQRKAILIGGIF